MSKSGKTLEAPEKPAMSLSALIKSDEEETSTPEVAEEGEIAEEGDSEVEEVTDIETDEDDDDISDADAEGAIVYIDKPKCLECGHLVAFAEKKFKGCHYTAGNKNCPAESVSIMIQIDTTKIVRNFLRAEEESDAAKLSELYAALATKADWIQRQVQDALQRAREKAAK